MADVRWDGAKWVPATASTSSVDGIRQLDWRQFVHLVAEGYRRNRYDVTVTGDRSDDGVDLIVSRGGRRWFVQCKHWRAYRVELAAVRALYGHMAAHGAAGGVLLTCGVVDGETQEFADRVGVQLVGAGAINGLIVEGTLPSTPAKRVSAVKADRAGHPSTSHPPARAASYASQHAAFSSHLQPPSRPGRRRGAIVAAVAVPLALAVSGAALVAQWTLLAAPVITPTPQAAVAEPRSVKVGARPVAIAVDVEARLAFTANADSGDITVIDLDTLTVTDRLAAPGRPAGIAVDGARRVVYVTDRDGASVYGISIDSGKQVLRLKTVKQPDHLAVDSTRRRLYVSSRKSQDVQVFDIKATKKLRPLEAGGPSALAMDERAWTLHVAKRGAGSISARDFDKKVWGEVCTGTAEVMGIAVDGQRHHLYSVAGDRWIRDVDLVGGSSAQRSIPSVAHAIAVDAVTRTAYVVDTGTDTVTEVTLD